MAKNNHPLDPSNTTIVEEDAERNPPTKSDSAWKRALERWFQPFLACFWPDIAKDIDWEQSIEELNHEMQGITAKSLVGKQLVDKLYKVHMTSNESHLILVHVEVQGDEEEDFSKRLFEYFYKVYDRYELPVLPLVVLSDDKKRWRPGPFEMRISKYQIIRYDFLSVKLLDWKGKEAKLLESNNPFKNLIAIYLKARETRQNPKARFKVKLEIYKHLLKRGWDRDDVLSFVNFLEDVMRLPEALELRYHNEVLKVEKTMNVNYLTNAEYFGHQAGLKEGIHEIAKKMRAMELDSTIIEEATGLTLSEIDSLG